MFKKLLVPLNGTTPAEEVLPVVEGLLRGGAEEATLFIVEPPPKATPQRRRGPRRPTLLVALPGVSACEVIPAALPSYAETRDQAIERREHELLEYLDEVGRPLLETGRPVHAAVHFGDPAQEIVNFARNGRFDLIVLARQRRSGVIAALVRSGVAPVLVLRPARVRSAERRDAPGALAARRG